MGSATWGIASKKKSILFDVLFVMDRANKVKSSKMAGFEYSLLKAETIKKYDAIYKIAINQSDLLAAAFYASKYVEEGKHDTIIYTYLFDKALEMVSFNEMVKFLEKSTAEDIAYYIAAACLSTKDKVVTRNEVAEIVKQGDRNLIEALYRTDLPEKIKMSVYLIVFNFDKFLAALIAYMKKIHKYIQNFYGEYADVYYGTKKQFLEFMSYNKEHMLMMDEPKSRMNDEKQRKKVMVLSLIRPEYSRIKHTKSILNYSKGIFALQRILHSNDFKIF